MEAIVLLSGGVDSTTCLAEAVARFGPDQVLALTIFYGQKHAKEIEAAKQVCAFYGVEQQIQDVSAVFALSDCPLLEGSTQAIDHAG